MRARLTLTISLILLAVSPAYAQGDDKQSAVVLEEGLWVTFYDLPSRRFRAIRTAVLTQKLDDAARDLSLTANYFSVEASRSSEVFQAPLQDVVDRLRNMSENIETVTLDDLDTLFGRAHWLLAQHYLHFARIARDARNGRNASLYLWATTHHIERAILWSDVAVTREVHTTLEGLQELAGRLGNPDTSARAFRERPIVRAEALLRKIGEQINRRVLLPAANAE
ncbi:MAG: hypothetical protein R3358_02400 [Woeseiaceae bacterium]|nr:hypothetical protein [Woeseiaceae bacterium]